MSNPEPDPDRTDAATRAADEDDALAPHIADRPPTPDEEEAAEAAGTEVPDSVAEAYREAAETGADIEGEGRI